MNYCDNMTACADREAPTMRQESLKELMSQIDSLMSNNLDIAIKLGVDLFGIDDENTVYNPICFQDAVVQLREKTEHLNRLLGDIAERTLT